MLLETLTFEKAVAIATPLAKKIFTAKIQPVIEKKFESFFKTRAAAKSFEVNSVKYLARITGQCSTMNTIAFQNAPKRLEDLYIPLTIACEKPKKNILVTEGIDIFQDHSHILINDTAGMGKSTLSKRVVLNVIAAGNYVPVFIELRQIEAGPIENQVKAIFGIPEGASEDLIKELPLLFVFDGLDEVPTDKKKEVVKYLKDFIEYVGDAKILITSRQESYLSEFYSFSRYSITPLENDEAFSLLKKYDSEGDLAETLIEGIRHERSRMVHDFLSTPLYVSLLFCSYRHKTIIPQRKDLFYSQVYDALFESHDLSKEIGFVRPKHSKLDSTEFHSVLRRLGFWCLKNNGKIEFQKDELEIVVADLISKISGLKSSPASFVKDLTTTVPLFVKEGTTLRWSHKSLMEYFAAMFICNDTKEKQKEVLIRVFHSEDAVSYKNVLELCCDIDFTTFRASILREILEEFFLYKETAYQHITNKRIPKSAIEQRITITFGHQIAFKIVSRDNLKKIFDDAAGETDFDVFKTDLKKIAGMHQILWGGSHSFYTLHCKTLSAEILEIISRKMPDLFVPIQSNADARQVLGEKLKKDHFYILNDAPENQLNNSKLFLAVNSLAATPGSPMFLNVDAAKKELEAIKNDASNGVALLLNDL